MSPATAHEVSTARSFRPSSGVPEPWSPAGARTTSSSTHPFGALPAFIVTSTPPDRVPQGATRFTFVADPATAISAARAVAGAKDVYIIGGARLGSACVAQRLVDEVHLHICPMILDALPAPCRRC
ncbi:MAG: dihydrofolate reductase family protein [Actinoallomurus sp.]